MGAALWFVYGAVTGLPDAETVRAVGSMSRATTIVDVKGRHAFTIFQEQRIPVPLSRVSPHLVRAIVALEDQRFYNHGGIDGIRVLGAAWNNVLERRLEQGGSTITQQLARLTFLTPDKTFRRKLQEIVVARRLENAFTKDEILELYLNKAYFGDGLYGVEAASLGYFGRHAAEVDVAEAALLAGLVKAPSTYAPSVDAERAIARRNLVLQIMRDAQVIDRATYESAVRTRLRLNDTLRREEAYGQYFKEEVRKQLVEQFGWKRVYLDGLTVETTLDLDVQKAADAEVARAILEIEERQMQRRGRQPASTADPLQAALVALDAHTGEVRALVGGRGFDRSRFNRATQARRQPGSAFKPFVYAAALERGYTPATVIGLTQPVMTVRGAWVPEDDHVPGDAITMRMALRASSNRAAVRMLQDVGIAETARFAEQLGMGSMPRVPSLALGSGEVTLLALTAAFGAFANEGMLSTPTLIRRVTTKEGDVLYKATLRADPVVSPATAYLMTSMLADVVNSGTAWEARRLGFRLPAAGKTGTTNEYRDAWFVGYTPNLVTGVWVGYDQPRTIMNGGYAAQLAVPLWARFMMAATRGDASEWFRAPSTVTTATICRLTGNLATDRCRQEGTIDTEHFHRGTEPTEWCLHPRDERPQQQPVVMASEVSAPSPPPATASAEVTTAASPPVSEVSAPSVEQRPSNKKRGFWARVFGIGRNGERKDQKK